MIVIKIGGAVDVDYRDFCLDVLHTVAGPEHGGLGERVVIVHGGGAATDALAEQLGHPPKYITSPSGHVSRYTDRQTLEIFVQATALINRVLVERLHAIGVHAIGLSGIDGRLMEARRKEAIRSVENGRKRIIRDDWTGAVTNVNDALLHTLICAGYIPVIAPLAISDRGEMLNVDGDRAAAGLASAVGAHTLLLLSNVAGLLGSFPDEGTLIKQLDRPELPTAMEWAQGRMKKKVLAAQEAMQRGVQTVIIGDGRSATPIRAALNGAGTTIRNDDRGRP